MGIFGEIVEIIGDGVDWAVRYPGRKDREKEEKLQQAQDDLQQAQDDEEARKNKLLRDLQIKKLQAEDIVTPQTKKKSTKAKKKSTKAKKKPAPAVKKYDPKLFDRQKREIREQLSEGLITERTAVIQKNRAIADEKMRLIIENQRKEKMVKSKTKPKKPTSASTKEFEYVEKLKEIKSLRKEGDITQAEFKKLKKKIIDSL